MKVFEKFETPNRWVEPDMQRDGWVNVFLFCTIGAIAVICTGVFLVWAAS